MMAHIKSSKGLVHAHNKIKTNQHLLFIVILNDIIFQPLNATEIAKNNA
jgi:hypothetical protein